MQLFGGKHAAETAANNDYFWFLHVQLTPCLLGRFRANWPRLTCCRISFRPGSYADSLSGLGGGVYVVLWPRFGEYVLE